MQMHDPNLATPSQIWLADTAVWQPIGPGDRLPWEVAGRGLQLGDGVFETLRWVWPADRGAATPAPTDSPAAHLPLWPQHRQRLRNAARVLGLRIPEALLEQLPQAVAALAAQMPAKIDQRVRLTLWRSGPGGYTPTTDAIHALLTLGAVPPLWPLPRPLRLSVWPDYRLRMDILSGIKRTSALPWVMAAQAARQHGTDDALLLDLSGNLAEASAANIFVLQGNRLLTPPLQSGCLPGVMRAEILRLAPTLGYVPAEEPLPPVALGTAHEVFLTNALRGCLPVESVRTTSRLYTFAAPGHTSAASRFQQLLVQLWGLGE